MSEMTARIERMLEEVRVRHELAAQGSDWSSVIEAFNNFGLAIKGIGRRLYLHMNPEVVQASQARHKQHQLRADVMRQCAGMRRRQGQ